MRRSTKLPLGFWVGLSILILWAFDHAMRVDARRLCDETGKEAICREAGVVR